MMRYKEGLSLIAVVFVILGAPRIAQGEFVHVMKKTGQSIEKPLSKAGHDTKNTLSDVGHDAKDTLGKTGNDAKDTLKKAGEVPYNALKKFFTGK